MTTKVKTHKRKRKNGVSIIKEHSRKDTRTSRRGSGDEYKKKLEDCDPTECSLSDLKDAEQGKWGTKAAKKAHKELKRRGKDTC